MLHQYSLTSTEDGYSFTTDAGIAYAIYFTVHYLKDKDGQEFTVPSLGFGPIGEKSNFHDVKIKNTIIRQLIYLLQIIQKNRFVKVIHPLQYSMEVTLFRD